MKRNLLFLIFGLFLFGTAQAQTLSVQGVLRDPNGKTVDDGSYQLLFKLYTTETGGSASWTETHASVPVVNGVFGVVLGKTTSMSALTFAQDYYLGISVEGRSELTPRITLANTPYAMGVNGVENKFPSVGSVSTQDSIILKDGHLVLKTGYIVFPDNTILNSAEGGTASAVSNAIDVPIVADNDTDGSGEITFTTNGLERMKIENSGTVVVTNTLQADAITVTNALEADAITVTNALQADAITAATSIVTPALRLSTGAASGYTIFSDASGNMAWSGTIFNDNSISSVGIGTSSLVTENSLSLGARSTTEGGQLQLQKPTSGTTAFSIDNNRNGGVDYFRVLTGTNTASVIPRFSIRETGHTRIGTNLAGTDEMLYVEGSMRATGRIYSDSYIQAVGNIESGGQIRGNGSASQSYTYHFLNSGGTGSGGSQSNLAVSVYGAQRMAASEFNAFSDVRIKRVKGQSNASNDLSLLSRIRITDYTFIDSIGKGNQMQKKVIAQELKSVYPTAVSTITDVIPDIYQMAAISKGHIAIKNDLKAGDKVRLIFEDKQELFEVISANADGFQVNSDKEGKVFVFGREVNDFHVVDYEALSTLNISATQELLRKVNVLEAENAKMKAALDELSGLKAQVEAMQQAMRQSGMLPAEGSTKK